MGFLQAVLALISAVLVLLLPGLAWQAWFPRPRLDPLERLAEALAFSLSVTALGGLAFYLIHIPVRLNGIFAFISLAFVAMMAGLWRHRAQVPVRIEPGAVAAVLLLAAIVLWRFYQLQPGLDVSGPALVIEKIFAAGGIPAGLGPEHPSPFADPVGYDLLAALFARLGDLLPLEAAAWTGAALSGAVSLSIYRLVKAVWGDSLRALLALLLSVFILQFPANLPAGQRFALAAGLAVLPVAMASLWKVEQFYRTAPGAAVPAPETRLLLVILTGGLALAHPLALVMFLLYAAVLACSRLVTLLYHWTGWRGLYRQAGIPLVLVIDGLVLASPWLIRVLAAGGAPPMPEAASASGWDYLLTLALLMVSSVALLRCLLHENWGARRLAVWGVLLAMLSLPVVRGSGPYSPPQFAAVLALPGVLFLADGAAWAWHGRNHPQNSPQDLTVKH